MNPSVIVSPTPTSTSASPSTSPSNLTNLASSSTPTTVTASSSRSDSGSASAPPPIISITTTPTPPRPQNNLNLHQQQSPGPPLFFISQNAALEYQFASQTLQTQTGGSTITTAAASATTKQIRIQQIPMTKNAVMSALGVGVGGQAPAVQPVRLILQSTNRRSIVAHQVQGTAVGTVRLPGSLNLIRSSNNAGPQHPAPIQIQHHQVASPGGGGGNNVRSGNPGSIRPIPLVQLQVQQGPGLGPSRPPGIMMTASNQRGIVRPQGLGNGGTVTMTMSGLAQQAQQLQLQQQQQGSATVAIIRHPRPPPPFQGQGQGQSVQNQRPPMLIPPPPPSSPTPRGIGGIGQGQNPRPQRQNQMLPPPPPPPPSPRTPVQSPSSKANNVQGGSGPGPAAVGGSSARLPPPSPTPPRGPPPATTSGSQGVPPQQQQPRGPAPAPGYMVSPPFPPHILAIFEQRRRDDIKRRAQCAKLMEFFEKKWKPSPKAVLYVDGVLPPEMRPRPRPPPPNNPPTPPPPQTPTETETSSSAPPPLQLLALPSSTSVVSSSTSGSGSAILALPNSDSKGKDREEEIVDRSKTIEFPVSLDQIKKELVEEDEEEEMLSTPPRLDGPMLPNNASTSTIDTTTAAVSAPTSGSSSMGISLRQIKQEPVDTYPPWSSTSTPAGSGRRLNLRQESNPSCSSSSSSLIPSNYNNPYGYGCWRPEQMRLNPVYSYPVPLTLMPPQLPLPLPPSGSSYLSPGLGLGSASGPRSRYQNQQDKRGPRRVRRKSPVSSSAVARATPVKNKEYKCYVCVKTFKYPTRLKTHLSKHFEQDDHFARAFRKFVNEVWEKHPRMKEIREEEELEELANNAAANNIFSGMEVD